MGEELGLEQAEVPAERALDPAGRDGCRAPLPWDASPSHGWGPEPWLPWPPEVDTRNVELLRRDEGSILHLYRRLLRARRESAALRTGDFELFPAAADGVIAYRRGSGQERRLIVINFRDQPARLEFDEPLVIDLASDGQGEGAPFTGDLAPDQALVLRRP